MLLTRSLYSFSLLGIFNINLNYILFLSIAFSHQLDIGWHTWISCFPFPLVFYFLVDLHLMTSFQIVPCCRTWLACLLFFSALVGKVSPAIFLYWSAIAVLSAHKVSGDEVSISPILRNISRVFFLLNSGLASLLFLVNDGSNKPIKYWLSLYVVGRTWIEVEFCLE